MRFLTAKSTCATVFATICVLIAMVQQGCDSSDESDLPESAPLPEATSEDVWKYISEDNSYTEGKVSI